MYSTPGAGFGRTRQSAGGVSFDPRIVVTKTVGGADRAVNWLLRSRCDHGCRHEHRGGQTRRTDPPVKALHRRVHMAFR